MCVCVWVCVYEYRCCQFRRRHQIPGSESFIQEVVSCLRWVLGTKLRPSSRAFTAETSAAPSKMPSNEKFATILINIPI